MSERAFTSPIIKSQESGVSVYSKEDEKFTGWSSLPKPQVVRVAFPEGAAPVFRTGEPADLVFTGTGDIRLFVPQASVSRCEYVPGQVTYSFQVRDTQWENIRESLCPRRSIRVSPQEPIELEIAGPDGNLKGQVEDLSETGISVNLPRDCEEALLRAGPHSLRFCLTPTEEPIEVLARLRYRASAGEDIVRCGFEFDTKATENYREKRWSVARFVWTQQEEKPA